MRGRVLVPGGHGRLARALAPRLRAAGWEVWAPPREELDLTAHDLGPKVRAFAPTRVILAASLTVVDACEADAGAAEATNVVGAARLVDAAGCTGIYVSTDYVFSGDGPHAEDAPPSPVSVYGRTKAQAEALALLAGWAVARTAWLWGDGAGFPAFVAAQGRRAGRVEVAAQVGMPTVVSDLADALVALLGDPQGIHHLVGGAAVGRRAWAEAVLDRLGIPAEVVERPSAEVFAGKAPRPPVSVLAVTRPHTPRLRAWQEALASLSASDLSAPAWAPT